MSALGAETPAADAVLEHLVQHYGGATGARALWQWAGGSEADLDYPPAPQALWRAQWERADGVDGRPAQVDLVRQALWDRPSAEPLIAWLRADPDDGWELARGLADLLAIQLERFAAVGFPRAGLRTAIRAQPALDVSAWFVALAPALEGVLGRESREALVAELQRLRTLDEVGAEVNRLRDELRDIMKDDPANADAEAVRLREAFRALKLRLGQPEEDDPGDLDKVRGDFSRVSRRFARREVEARPLQAALALFMASFPGARTASEAAASLPLLRGLEDALYASRPAD